MNHQSLKRFIEQVYCIEYKPENIVPQLHKNTEYKKYFMHKPYASGFLQTEFFYDVQRNKFMPLNHEVDWDPLTEDTFS